MRFFDNGAFFTVTISEREVDDWNRSWPCSTLEGKQSFQFHKRNGDLVDRAGKGDGAEAVALSQDAFAYGNQRRSPLFAALSFTKRRVVFRILRFHHREDYLDKMWRWHPNNPERSTGFVILWVFKTRKDAREYLRRFYPPCHGQSAGQDYPEVQEP